MIGASNNNNTLSEGPPSLQVQPEHHNNYNQIANRQLQWQSRCTDQQTAVTQATSSMSKDAGSGLFPQPHQYKHDYHPARHSNNNNNDGGTNKKRDRLIYFFNELLTWI